MFFHAPGLQHSTAGEVCGSLSQGAHVVAKPIVADRLDFRGRPNFDAKPFLDPRGQRIYDTPVDESAPLSSVDVDIPTVRIFGKDSEVWKLLRKLDDSGRLGLLKESDIFPGFQAGLFSVQKDACKDRLIFDSRPWNVLETPPRRWIASMACATSLCDLMMEPQQVCVVSGTDLREFYYSFKASKQRLIRNSLLISAWPSEVREFSCYDSSFDSYRGKLYFALATLAMGDACAVEVAQTAHIGLLVQGNLLEPSELLSMNLAIPRGPTMTGVVIDDLVLFELISKDLLSGDLNALSSVCRLDSALERYKSLGLIPHPDKTFKAKLTEDFWGSHFEGGAGYVRASLKRVVPILFITLGIIRLGVSTLNLLEVVIGCWTSTFLFKRRLLSLLNVVYEAAQRMEDRKSVIRLSSELKTELLLCCIFAPVACTFLKAMNSTCVFASDASDWGFAVCSAELPEWLRTELHRHRLRKSVWTRLLSPLKSIERLQGRLDPSDELPGDEEELRTHPLWIELVRSLQFRVISKRRTSDGVHINVSELRGMLDVEKQACRQAFPVRLFSLADSQVGLGCLIKGRSSSLALNQELQQSLPIHIGCGVINNSGFLPSAENVADDPTRHVELRKPVKVPEPWLFPSADFAGSSDHLTSFDDWLEARNASPYQLSGLPSFSELFPEFSEDLSWTRKQRRSCKKPKSSRGVNVERPSQAADAQDGPGRDVASDLFLYPPSASDRNMKCLSLEAISWLRKIPRSRFIFPKSWKVDDDWLPDFPGYLDLYSGEKGIAKAIVEKGQTWAVCFELEDGPDQDVLLSQNRELIHGLLTSNAVSGFGAAIFCSSFSRAVRPSVRSRLSPYGLENLSPAMQTKVDLGNAHSSFLASCIRLCLKHNIKFWVENPDGSFLWLCEEWITLGSLDRRWTFRLDYCVCGTPWRKRTRFLTSCHLQGQCVWCSRKHSHLKLAGWSRYHKKSWTRVAQTYPRRLCNWVASAMLIDMGFLPHRRRIDVAAMAKQIGGRIGEAQHPGPRRRGARVRRDVFELDEARLVEPGTLALGARIWDGFFRWGLNIFGDDCFRSLVTVPETLAVMLELFGRHLFENGQSIYLMRQLVTHVQRTFPDFRRSLGRVWQLVARWETLIPIQHRTPLPLVIFQAMVALAISLGWMRWAGIAIIGFEGICRPGEPLQAVREDLLLPRDLVVENPAVVFLCIKNPKSRRRGLGLVQHAKIVNLSVARFLDRVFGPLPRKEPLFQGSPSSFRRRWDHLLSLLDISSKLGLTPASLRSGGAVRAYRADEELTKILWRMRIKNIETLQHYLQELGAISVFQELSLASKNKISTASSLYSSLLDSA